MVQGGAYYAKVIDPATYQAGTYSFICILRSSNNSYYTYPVYATFVNNSPPTISVNSPTSGNYAIDNSMYIGWSSQNVGSNVSIEAIRSSDGAKFVIADPTSNDGSYSSIV